MTKAFIAACFGMSMVDASGEPHCSCLDESVRHGPDLIMTGAKRWILR